MVGTVVAIFLDYCDDLGTIDPDLISPLCITYSSLFFLVYTKNVDEYLPQELICDFLFTLCLP